MELLKRDGQIIEITQVNSHVLQLTYQAGIPSIKINSSSTVTEQHKKMTTKEMSFTDTVILTLCNTYYITILF